MRMPVSPDFNDEGGDMILVRDSKDPDGLILRFTSAEWDAFIDAVNRGIFGGENLT